MYEGRRTGWPARVRPEVDFGCCSQFWITDRSLGVKKGTGTWAALNKTGTGTFATLRSQSPTYYDLHTPEISCIYLGGRTLF
jgi:hypothetical protein